MPRRPLLACLFLLLAACAGEAPKPVTAPTPAKPEVAIKPAVPIAASRMPVSSYSVMSGPARKPEADGPPPGPRNVPESAPKSTVWT